ncbi:MAG: DUF1499 domain-containing protein [Pseudomonadota bacterium]
MNEKKWWSNALLIGGVIALVTLPIGALGTKLGLWAFTGGFMVLGVGVVLATAVFFLGVIAVVYTSVKGMTADRTSAAVGLVISLVVLGVMGSQFAAGTQVPPIHNISTDLVDPPQFKTLVADREAEGANPLALTDEVKDQQRGAYPQLKSLISGSPDSELFPRALQVLKDMGMEIADADAGAGIIEATDETFWFGFKDDVVVRIRAEGSGSVVDVRSVSRVGQSDLGKNAARIAEILAGIGAN